MKVFNNFSNAIASIEVKDKIWLNSYCPYRESTKLCGNWCALFHFNSNSNNKTPYVILGCKSTDKMLFVDGIENS